MADNNEPQGDGSVQQFPELWESSRVSKRMTITEAEVKAEFQLPGLSLSDQGTSAILKDSTDQEGLQFSTPTWQENTVVRQQQQVTRSPERYEGCSSCGFQLCICKNLSRSTFSSLPTNLHKEWLSGPGTSSIDPQTGGFGSQGEIDGDHGKNVPCLVRPSPGDNAGTGEDSGEDYEVHNTTGDKVNAEEARMKFQKNYSLQLSNLQGQLRNHVRVHAADAMKSCKEIEKQLFNMTGVETWENNGATMSDDEEEVIGEPSNFGARMQTDILNISALGCGPLVPSQTERQILERVREELKLHLGEKGYRNKLIEVREEILRKRRAGKLPEGTTTILKTWWEAHSRWPYPTEDEKEILIQETGLELKQVNNWFINQRKRNWHNNPLSPSNDNRNKRKPS